jgi:hypothetical protein
MTLYLNFRSQSVGGAIVGPYLLEGNGTTAPPALKTVAWTDIAPKVAGKDVLLGVHGFNVNYRNAANAFGLLDGSLGLGGSEIFIGVLWPGDFWIPAVNYPFEGSDAMECGRRLADFCTRWLSEAQSLSFFSHSLGARLTLEAVTHLDRRARMLCLTAAAINRDCLTAEYRSAAANADSIFLLASHSDTVLRLAFPLGDPISNILDHDHAFFGAALGYEGPPPPADPPVAFPWQIQDGYGYKHGSYLPPTDPAAFSQRVTDFVRRAFRGQPRPRPGALD